MNIVMALPPTEAPDAEKHVVNLSDELLRRGHRVFIFSDLMNRESEAEHITFNFKYSGIPGLIRNTLALHRLIKDVGADVIHAHGPNRVVYRAARMKDIPLVTTLHDCDTALSLQDTCKICGRRILAAWEQVKTCAIESGGIMPEKIGITHLGADPDYFTPRAFKRKTPRPIVSLTGDLTRAEGGVALKMMQDIFEFDKYDVRIIGIDRLPAEFAEFENNIELIGASEDVRTYLAESDVVVASGSAAVEALMMGRPVVAAGAGGIIGLIDEVNIDRAIACGFGNVADNNDSSHNCETIRSDIERGIAWRYVSDEVHETILREFNLNDAADRMEKIFEELTGGQEE